MTQLSVKSLYDQDFALWVEKTVQQLNAEDFQNVDWQNLMEEIGSLGKSQRKAVRSCLQRLLEHLLKRCYVPLADCYREWEIEIRNFRENLDWELADYPSLKGFILDILEKSYQKALINMRQDYPAIAFPDSYPFSRELDALLTEVLWD